MRFIAFWFCLSFALNTNAQTIGQQVEIDLGENPRHLAHIKNISTLELPAAKLGGEYLHSLSALAYSQDNKILYALSDKGNLFWLRLNFNPGGYLENLRWLKTCKLKNANGKPLQGKKYADAEGMDIINSNNGIKGDEILIVSFERKHRIWLMSPEGSFIKKLKLPTHYAKGPGFHKKNKGLESVTNHPALGVLSSLEMPKKDKGQHQIFSLKPYKVWQVPRIQFKKASLTSMENMPNGSLLLLERSYNDLFTPLVIGLKRLDFNHKPELIKITQLALFNNADNWYIDNFEGLAHIKSNRYCMVSDNNNDPWQRTLLTCFIVAD